MEIQINSYISHEFLFPLILPHIPHQNIPESLIAENITCYLFNIKTYIEVLMMVTFLLSLYNLQAELLLFKLNTQ